LKVCTKVQRDVFFSIFWDGAYQVIIIYYKQTVKKVIIGIHGQKREAGVPSDPHLEEDEDPLHGQGLRLCSSVWSLTEENISTKEGWSDGRVEKTA
jgi:hypothetical protein